MALPPPAAIDKIAVVRANGIGDYLFAEPALSALAAAYPQAEIVLLGKPWHARCLTNRPGAVDRVVVIPAYGGVSAEPGSVTDDEAIDDFFAAMQAERFDLALQMHGGGRYSNPFTRRLQARWSVGMRAKDAEPLDHDIPYYYFQPEVLRYLEVVSLVGAVPTRLVPSFAVTPSDEQELDSLALDPTAPLAVLHPGATDPRRRWPPAQFAAVGQALVDAGAQVAVVGAGDERQLVRAVLAALPSDAHDLCDRLTLGGLAALLARSRVVVANDSGPLHLADAVGTCTVGVFWCGNMINGGPTTRRRHRPVISWRLTCPVCERNTLFDNCAHRVSFVADAPLADAKAAALELLGTGTPLYSASRSEKSAGGASRGNGAAAP